VHTFEQIGGTNFDDVLKGGSPDNTIEAFGGNDTASGGRGNDTLSAGAGNNSMSGGLGNDVVFARNAGIDGNSGIDTVECGEDTDGSDIDRVERDTVENRVIGCERGNVGTLRLTPKRVRVEAGEPARLRLSWRHPRAWKQLRTIELRLTRDGRPVGEITIRPRRERTAAGGGAPRARPHRGSRPDGDGQARTAA
jgi:Ca2+-binding RTX toxin-like protein